MKCTFITSNLFFWYIDDPSFSKQVFLLTTDLQHYSEVNLTTSLYQPAQAGQRLSDCLLVQRREEPQNDLKAGLTLSKSSMNPATPISLGLQTWYSISKEDGIRCWLLIQCIRFMGARKEQLVLKAKKPHCPHLPHHIRGLDDHYILQQMSKDNTFAGSQAEILV